MEKPLSRTLDLGQHRVQLDTEVGIITVHLHGTVSAKEAEDLMAWVVGLSEQMAVRRPLATSTCAHKSVPT